MTDQGPISCLLQSSPNGDEFNKRKPNFSDNEKFYLVRQYEHYRTVLGSRDGGSNKDKQLIWQLIAEELNQRNSTTVRTPMEVRKKWQNLVTFARKEVKEAEMRGTCPALPWIWRKVNELAGSGTFSSFEEESISSNKDQNDAFEQEATGSAIIIHTNAEKALSLDDIKEEAQSPVSEETNHSTAPPEEAIQQQRNLSKRKHSVSPGPWPDDLEFPPCRKFKSMPRKEVATSRQMEERIKLETFEQRRMEMELQHKAEAHEWERRKSEVEISLFELEKQKRLLEIELLRKQVNSFKDSSSNK